MANSPSEGIEGTPTSRLYILKNGPLDIRIIDKDSAKRIIDKEPFSPLLCPQKIYKAICTHIPYPTLTLLTI